MTRIALSKVLFYFKQLKFNYMYVYISGNIDQKADLLTKIEEFASEIGLNVHYDDSSMFLEQIQNAIKCVTGLNLGDYTTPSKDLPRYYARMIFTHFCEKYRHMRPEDIGPLINRDKTSVRHCSKQFKNEIQVNRVFREMVEKVGLILSESVSL